jgi:hypothetical protein
MSVDRDSLSRPTPLPPIPAPSPPASERGRGRECGICQSLIEPDEQTHKCPSCGLSFHAECWEENLGCSAYGCNQVNALKPPENSPEEFPLATVPAAEDPTSEPAPPFPWDHLILGLCVIAMLFSAVTFGVPSLLALLAILTRLNFRDRIETDLHPGLLGTSAGACIIGIIGGWMISSFWWLHG